MKTTINYVYLILGLACCVQCSIAPPKPIYPIPTPHQQDWHEMELNAFLHFSINTFTDKEWGYGDEDPALFNPTDFDAEQWVRVLKEAGFKGVVLTAKHHDGFCLWPSKYTKHSVANTPKKIDVVKALSEACKKHKIKFGIYLSPWDRNHAAYGSSQYIAYYRNQITEIINNYGPIFEMWMDGANGGDGYYGGERAMRKIDGSRYYDWPTTTKLVRGMQPHVIFFSDAGPDIRWVGNEAGYVGETNWNTMSLDTLYAGKANIESLLNTGSPDGKHWVPGEVDVSIRKGWFFHEKENTSVKNGDALFNIYLSSVGRGSNLLLNVPPDRRGKIHELDVAALQAFKSKVDEAFRNNIASKAKLNSTNTRGKKFAISMAADQDPATFFATKDRSNETEIICTFDHVQSIKYIVLGEHIALGQRINKYTVEQLIDGKWVLIAQGTTVGRKRIIQLSQSVSSKYKISLSGKNCLTLSKLEMFN